jgi:uncharacterized coiled-coil protein SlyX
MNLVAWAIVVFLGVAALLALLAPGRPRHEVRRLTAQVAERNRRIQDLEQQLADRDLRLAKVREDLTRLERRLRELDRDGTGGNGRLKLDRKGELIEEP